MGSEKRELLGRAVLRGARGQGATQCALAVILGGDCTVSAPAAVGGSDAPSQHREAPHGHTKLSQTTEGDLLPERGSTAPAGAGTSCLWLKSTGLHYKQTCGRERQRKNPSRNLQGTGGAKNNHHQPINLETES